MAKVVCGAMVAIAMPYDWLASLFSGVVFALAHTSEGRPSLRRARRGHDGAYGARLRILIFRRAPPQPLACMVMFGLSMGMAATIKPTVSPLGFALLFAGLLGDSVSSASQPHLTWLLDALAPPSLPPSLSPSSFATIPSPPFTRSAAPLLSTTPASTASESLGFMLRTMLPKVATVLLPFSAARCDRGSPME